VDEGWIRIFWLRSCCPLGCGHCLSHLEPNFVPAALTDSNGLVPNAERFKPLVERIQKQPQQTVQTINWSGDAAEAESFHAIPLLGRNKELLGVLLVGSSRRELVTLTRHMLHRWRSCCCCDLIGLLVSLWVAARITTSTRGIDRSVAGSSFGRWDTNIDLRGRDEIGQLASAFNEMTQTLAAQKDKLVQTERVAAWRELARRLAHELRNPLFPLQIYRGEFAKSRSWMPSNFWKYFRSRRPH